MQKKKKLSIKERIGILKESSSYRIAYEDQEFIHNEWLRPVRIQLELLKPSLSCFQHDIKSTIVCFGSARIPDAEGAKTRLKELEEEAARSKKKDAALAHRLRVAKRMIENSKYYEEARRFGALVSKYCQGNPKKKELDYVIVTGGGPGIMEAANRGADDVGAKTIGFNITLPFEQEPNPYISPELCFRFHYFSIRKMHLAMLAKALVIFPGGFGTMDEFFELLTLVQTRKIEPLPIILFGRDYWTKLINFQQFVDEGMIDPDDLKLFRYAETADDAWKHILKFYKRHPELGQVPKT